jgi:hypothetical protein
MVCFIDFHKMDDSGCRLKGEHLENLIFLSFFFRGFVFNLFNVFSLSLIKLDIKLGRLNKCLIIC